MEVGNKISAQYLQNCAQLSPVNTETWGGATTIVRLMSYFLSVKNKIQVFTFNIRVTRIVRS